jgi:hypothetical protein
VFESKKKAQLQGSPFIAKLGPGPLSPPHCEVQVVNGHQLAPGVRASKAGMAAEIVIKGRDRFGNSAKWGPEQELSMFATGKVSVELVESTRSGDTVEFKQVRFFFRRLPHILFMTVFDYYYHISCFLSQVLLPFHMARSRSTLLASFPRFLLPFRSLFCFGLRVAAAAFSCAGYPEQRRVPAAADSG